MIELRGCLILDIGQLTCTSCIVSDSWPTDCMSRLQSIRRFFKVNIKLVVKRKKTVRQLYTLWGIKTHQIFFAITWRKVTQFFNKFWHEYSWYNWPSDDCLVSHLTHCLFLHYLGKENEQNIAIFITLVLLLNQNNAQNTHFVYIFIV